MMPKKSGMKTYRGLKKDPDLRNIPVIIITGISKEVDFKNLLNRASTGKLPPEGHLTKPLTAENLIEEIRKVLG
jgi:CheY-like chemotaxis protein